MKRVYNQVAVRCLYWIDLSSLFNNKKVFYATCVTLALGLTHPFKNHLQLFDEITMHLMDKAGLKEVLLAPKS